MSVFPVSARTCENAANFLRQVRVRKCVTLGISEFHGHDLSIGTRERFAPPYSRHGEKKRRTLVMRYSRKCESNRHTVLAISLISVREREQTKEHWLSCLHDTSPGDVNDKAIRKQVSFNPINFHDAPWSIQPGDANFPFTWHRVVDKSYGGFSHSLSLFPITIDDFNQRNPPLELARTDRQTDRGQTRSVISRMC